MCPLRLQPEQVGGLLRSPQLTFFCLATQQPPTVPSKPSTTRKNYSNPQPHRYNCWAPAACTTFTSSFTPTRTNADRKNSTILCRTYLIHSLATAPPRYVGCNVQSFVPRFSAASHSNVQPQATFVALRNPSFHSDL